MLRLDLVEEIVIHAGAAAPQSNRVAAVFHDTTLCAFDLYPETSFGNLVVQTGKPGRSHGRLFLPVCVQLAVGRWCCLVLLEFGSLLRLQIEADDTALGSLQPARPAPSGQLIGGDETEAAAATSPNAHRPKRDAV
jgi:hypothetical protein